MLDKKETERWVSDIASGLAPLFKALDFRKSGKLKFLKSENGEWESRYILSFRHPRYKGDPVKIYINPCVHVYYPALEKANSIFTGQPLNRNFPTLGGSIGLYSEFNNSKEWPVNDQKDACLLVPRFKEDIKEVALPFWANLTPQANLLKTVEQNKEWAKVSDFWKYRHLILRYCESGLEHAMDLVKQNSGKYWEFDIPTIEKKLLELPVDILKKLSIRRLN